MSGFDDEFAQEAKRAEAEEKAKLEQRGKRSSEGFGSNFEELKWTGFSDDTPTKVLRFMGKHPDLHYGSSIPDSSPYDAHVVNMARVVGDNGKQMDLYLPLKDRNSNHIIWRIIDRVNAVEWRKKPDPKDPKKTVSDKVYINQTKFPDIYNIINFNNLPPENLQRKFGLIGRGWMGREILMANVIDRAMAQWHSENKHTALLAKKITVKQNADGSSNEFVEKGLPAYGLNSQLNSLRKTYGDWEKFDIGFTRTGSKDTPNKVFNACRVPEELPDNLQGTEVSTPLTSEELAYTQYNIAKLFGVTSYTKLWNRLHITIERIDSCLGTNYATELKKLAEEEAEARAEANEANSENEEQHEPDDFLDAAKKVASEVSTNAQEATVNASTEPQRVVTRQVATKKASKEDMPGYAKMTEAEKANILEVEAPVAGSKEWKIKFADTTGGIAACPECGTVSPTSYTTCPCGLNFAF